MFGNLWENARSNKWCFLINVMWQNLQNGGAFNTIRPGIDYRFVPSQVLTFIFLFLIHINSTYSVKRYSTIMIIDDYWIS